MRVCGGIRQGVGVLLVLSGVLIVFLCLPMEFFLIALGVAMAAAGLLLAARSDYIEVNGRRYPRTPVALSEHPVSDGGGYHALWGDPEGEEVSARAERAVSAASDTAAETQQAG